MSQLDLLLAGELTPGVYRWPAAPPTAKAKAVVDQEGWHFVDLDTTTVVDKAGLLDAVAKTLGYPAYLGRSFDAFAELLAEVRHEHGVVLWWQGWAGLAELNPQATELALAEFATRAADREQGVLAVVVAGPGPVLDVPTWE